MNFHDPAKVSRSAKPDITPIGLLVTSFTHLQKGKIGTDIPIPTLSQGGRSALTGIVATAVILLICSSLDIQLGLPTAVTGLFTSAVVVIRSKKESDDRYIGSFVVCCSADCRPVCDRGGTQ